MSCCRKGTLGQTLNLPINGCKSSVLIHSCHFISCMNSSAYLPAYLTYKGATEVNSLLQINISVTFFLDLPLLFNYGKHEKFCIIYSIFLKFIFGHQVFGKNSINVCKTCHNLYSMKILACTS